MDILIVDNDTRHIKALANLFGDSAIIIKARDFNAKSVKQGTLVILSGSKKHAVIYDDDFFKEQKDLIKYYDGPIIGICAGFELIAKTFGANITRRKRRLHRLVKIDNKKVYEAHRYTIKLLPDTIQVIASSKSGVEIIKHRTKPIYGLQFHPEVHYPPNNGTDFLDEIISQIKD